jgi:phosphoserine phosphatase
VKPGGSHFECVRKLAASEAARSELQRLNEKFMPLFNSRLMGEREEISWLAAEVDIYVKHGLTVASAESALEHLKFRDGVGECLEMLSDLGVPVAVVSWGIANFIEAALRAKGLLQFVTDVFALRLIADRTSGAVIGFERGTVVVPSNKGRWSRQFADGLGVSRRRILAVGDTLGDRHLGSSRRNRLGLAHDETDAAKIGPVMGEVIVTDGFRLATEWLKFRLNR